MSQFSVKPESLKESAAMIGNCATSLQVQNNILQGALSNPFYSGAAYNSVLEQLQAISTQLTKHQTRMITFQEAAEKAAEFYIQAEENTLKFLQKTLSSNTPLTGPTAPTRGLFFGNNNNKQKINWFKDGSFMRFLQELYEAGLITFAAMKEMLAAYLTGDDEAMAAAFQKLIDSLAAEGEADLKALIPRYLSNEGFVALYQALATGDAGDNKFLQFLVNHFQNTMTPEEIQAHYEANCQELADSGVYTPGEYIENQGQWGNIAFGSDTEYPFGVSNLLDPSNMAQSGCEIIAVANALHAMGYDLSYDEMAGLIQHFEESGMVMDGQMGTSPAALVDYLQDQGYVADFTTTTDSSTIAEYSENYDTYVVTAYNNKDDINGMVHTVCITKEADGSYVVHNGGGTSPASYDSLEDAIAHIGGPAGNSEAISITGVADPAESSTLISGGDDNPIA